MVAEVQQMKVDSDEKDKILALLEAALKAKDQNQLKTSSSQHTEVKR